MIRALLMGTLLLIAADAYAQQSGIQASWQRVCPLRAEFRSNQSKGCSLHSAPERLMAKGWRQTFDDPISLSG
jgi:hypothetical protein